MWRLHGMKGDGLTTGGPTDVWKEFRSMADNRRQESAETKYRTMRWFVKG